MSFWLLDKLTYEDRADPVKVSLRGRRGRTNPVNVGGKRRREEGCEDRREKEGKDRGGRVVIGGMNHHSLSLTPSPSLPPPHTLFLILTPFPSLPLPHSLSLTPSPLHPLPHSLPHPYSLDFPQSLSFTRFLSLTPSPLLPLTHSLSLTPSHSLSLTPSHSLSLTPRYPATSQPW